MSTEDCRLITARVIWRCRLTLTEMLPESLRWKVKLLKMQLDRYEAQEETVTIFYLIVCMLLDSESRYIQKTCDG